MADYKAEISHDDYLKALALFTMANEHYVKASEFAAAVNRIIMVTPEQYTGGHVDDAIYASTRQSVADFDEAVRREGVKIAEAAPEEKSQ